MNAPVIGRHRCCDLRSPQLAGWQAAGGDCADLSLKALDIMERVVAAATLRAVIGGKRSLRDAGRIDVPQINLARLSLLGFDEARGLAAFGGAVDRQRPMQQALEELDKLRRRQHRSARSSMPRRAIRAAVAAAQDESGRDGSASDPRA